MTLLSIVLATLAGGVLSVLVAALLTQALLGRLVKHLVSLSAGVLLGASLLHVLPEAFESQASSQELFLCLLGGLLFFFLLEKVELYRHTTTTRATGMRTTTITTPSRPDAAATRCCWATASTTSATAC
jgi:zinc transporter ZupT